MLDQAVVDVIAAQRLYDAATGMLVDSLAGHPLAARYDGHTDQTARLWCFVHEQDHRRCEHDALACGGTPVTGSDPTGEAAMEPDRAATALAVVDDAVARVATAAATLATELTAWSPMTAGIDRPDPSSVTAPLGWCVSCWRDDRRHEPIGTRPGGTAPYYSDLCGWCGRFKKAHKGELPTPEQIRKYHAKTSQAPDREIGQHRSNGSNR
jgi:hypothetical protein